MKPIITLKSFLFLFVLAFVVSSNQVATAQEPYTGSQRFKVGDMVEATYLGDWKKAAVVGGYEDNGFGGTYEIQFEGDKYSAGRISSKWVRPRQTNESPVKTNQTVQNNRADDSEDSEKPSGGQFNAGDDVLYTSGTVIWASGAEILSYDAGKRQYRLKLKSGSGDIVPCHSVVKPGEKINNNFFIGRWDVRIIGATSTFERDGDLYRRYSSGMKLPPLEIKADGTYVWLTDKGTIRGTWQPRPEGVPGIVLLKGEGGLDYTLYEKTEGYAPSKDTRDEIGLHHIPSSTGYYIAYRIGENKSCVLTGRTFNR